MKKKSALHDAIDFVGIATRSLHRDNFTPCFRPIMPDELNGSGVFYVFSIFIRYFILLPFRIITFLICTVYFVIWFFVILIQGKEKEFPKAFLFYIKVFTFCLGAKVNHIGHKRKLNEPHIFVANHTSFLDFIILSAHKFVHAGVAEAHGGLFGLLFRLFLTKNGSLLFKRSDRNERIRALNLIKEHVKSNRASMLIFPEGTCVNNKHTVLFQKGAFQLDAVVCPVAIDYKKRLHDPYWNTTKHTFFIHCLYLMSRWKVEVDVHWLDPIRIEENESASDFAMRTNELIAKTVNLKLTKWNGYFKSAPVLKDRELLKEAYKAVYLDHKIRRELIYENFYKMELREKYKAEYIAIYGKEETDDDTSVFYNLNYKKYLDFVLFKYLEFKNDPEKLVKIREEKEEAFAETDVYLEANYMRTFAHGAHPLCVCNFSGLIWDDKYEYTADAKTLGCFNLFTAYKYLGRYY